jgi:hypothetical protein
MKPATEVGIHDLGETAAKAGLPDIGRPPKWWLEHFMRQPVTAEPRDS